MKPILDFFNSANIMPHGHCFLWQPDILWLHVLSDAGIAAAYYLIPLVLLYFILKRKDMPLKMIFVLFATFIWLCGTTHLMSIWVLWHPDYAVEGVIKALTAIASIATFIVSLYLIPKALPLVSPAEIAKVKMASQLQSSEARLRAVVENTLDGIITINARGIISTFNPAGERIFGYKAAEVIGQNIKMLMPEPYHSKHDGYISHYVETGEAKIIGSAGRELTARRKDGSTFPIDLSISAFQIDDGQHFLGTVRDITERKVEEESLREAKGAAEKANRTKDLFLATLSHELRTPLTAISGWAQLLKSGRLDPSKTRIGLQAIEDGVLSQNQLISDLLDISRINAGKISLEIQDTDLTDIVGKAVAMVRVTAEKKSIHMIEQPGSAPVFVPGDAGRLKQIVWNLLTNAIKFTPPGGSVEVMLGTCEDPSGRKAQIRVRDTGKGIPAAFLPHIFERFSQADSSSVRVHGGLGLGLALVHSLVKLQGGTVGAQSEGEGKGATFTVTLPLASAQRFAGVAHEAFPSAPAAGYAAGEGPSASLSGIRVLLVDDEQETRHVVGEMLSSFGARVSLASSVLEALAEFKRSSPDVIVSDIAMPLEDGYSLIRKVRKLGHEKGGGTPAVALTAYADSQSRDLALSAGYQAHLAKPVDSDELARTILKWSPQNLHNIGR